MGMVVFLLLQHLMVARLGSAPVKNKRTAAGLFVIGGRPNSIFPELPLSILLICRVDLIWLLDFEDITKYILSKYFFIRPTKIPKHTYL